MAAKYTYLDIIDRAKIYVDDNNRVTEGWKTKGNWAALLRPEVISCYRKWLRNGLISLSWGDQAFTGPTFVWDDSDLQPLCIIGVVQNMGNWLRPVPPGQPDLGRASFFQPIAGNNGATCWTASFGFVPQLATEVPDNSNVGYYQLRLHPEDTSSNYIVRYIPEPYLPRNDAALATTYFYAPEGYEDYVALRLARKLIATEGGSSQSIERLIAASEEEMKFEAMSNPQGEGPKVRIVRPFRERYVTGSSPWQMSPSRWYYF